MRQSGNLISSTQSLSSGSANDADTRRVGVFLSETMENYCLNISLEKKRCMIKHGRTTPSFPTSDWLIVPVGL